MDAKGASFQSVLDRAVDAKKVFGTCFALHSDRYAWCGASGDLALGQPFFIASTTKLFTTALVLNLRARAMLSLEDRVSDFLSPSVVNGLHVRKGVDHSHRITIQQLLAHTSGLPDYFFGKGAGGKSLAEELMAGHDRAWTPEEAIEMSKRIPPRFAPGAKGRAHYSDTNFQLLGRIIETIADRPFVGCCEEWITAPLGLQHTYLYQDPADTKPKTLYHKAAPLSIPRAMASFGPDGGMVSTASDLLTFIRGFFEGWLFPAHYIAGLQRWNSIFFPLQAGVGIHRFRLPWLLSPGGRLPQFIGHSGLSGALAFHSPRHKLYIAGTVNQTAHPGLSFRVMLRLAQAAIRS